MYKKILIPIDRSEHSQKSVEHGIALASSFDAEIVLLHCYDYPEILNDEFLIYGIPDSYIQNIKKNIESHSQEFLQGIKDKCIENKVSVTIEFREGHPGHNIVTAAEELNADLIVMGSRHMGMLKRLIFTSSSNYVLHHSKISIFVI
ncbi:universal stress protein [Candidatus Uabimicrobium amorphum]|uniref:Universal stress protein n=1 Tax=Uabimicrobium amorphum TaxID=2596890 RepID=A0A5S9F3I4_UABAM|nr:universal stress protein [Candidatus Uabimicrobium amorphum]BBM84183.1 Universal stress protein [Candidatus Uabimicrobium amorphum]